MNEINDNKYLDEPKAKEEFISLKKETFYLCIVILVMSLFYQIIKDSDLELTIIWLFFMLIVMFWGWVRMIKAGFFKFIMQDIKQLQGKIDK